MTSTVAPASAAAIAAASPPAPDPTQITSKLASFATTASLRVRRLTSDPPELAERLGHADGEDPLHEIRNDLPGDNGRWRHDVEQVVQTARERSGGDGADVAAEPEDVEPV